MSAPFLFIGIPLIAATLLWYYPQDRIRAFLAAGIFCLGMMVFAAAAPIDRGFELGPLSIPLPSVFVIFGRRFILAANSRYFLMLVFFFSSAWFFAACLTRAQRTFAAVGIAVVALLIAATAVEPFLYSALLIETAVLFTVPLLAPLSKRPRKGILRYLIFQTLAVPFILLAGWASAEVEINPTNEPLMIQAVIFLGLGFAIWLAVFPFYTWAPMLAGETYPLLAGFVFSIFPLVVFNNLLDYLNAYGWLWNNEMLTSALQISGVLMAASAGLWAAFEKNLARIIGYALIFENGFSLLAISAARDSDLKLFAFLILPRMVGFLFWSLTLSLLEETNSLELDALNGLFRRKPTYAIMIVVCCLSMGGFPLLAGFPAQSALLAKIAQQSATVAGVSMLGSFGMLVAGFRALAVFVNSNSEEWLFQENRLSMIVLGVGVLLLLGLGFFPQLFSASMTNLLQAFGKIAGI